MLGSTIFALRAMVHTTTQYTQAQVVFGGDSISNQRQDEYWQAVRKKNRFPINECNKCKNRNSKYEQGDKVLLKNAWKTKFNQDFYLDPYVIASVRNNGTVKTRSWTYSISEI